MEQITRSLKGDEKASRVCPNCYSKRNWKDGKRKTVNLGIVQRYICRDCDRRFSKSSVLSRRSDYSGRCQVGAVLTEAKNLTEVEPQKSGLAGATADINGKLVEFVWWMKKNGYSQETIRMNRTILKILAKRGAQLMDPESVKEVIANNQSWGENRKRNVINAYSLFLKLNRLHWEKPKVHVTQKFPFIPNEDEIDALIAGSGKKTATFLQLLKETAMRSGEAKRLQWIDIDFKRNLVTLNSPEKGSNPRMWRITPKLSAMLNALPEKSQYIFGSGPITSMKTTFMKVRKRLAMKLQNPRLQKISFHTFRHWKATMLQHQTRDPWYVKQFLGHKSIRNTEIYINIANSIFEASNEEFTVRVVEKPEEVKDLLEVGFEYVCQKESLMFLRKRK